MSASKDESFPFSMSKQALHNFVADLFSSRSLIAIFAAVFAAGGVYFTQSRDVESLMKENALLRGVPAKIDAIEVRMDRTDKLIEKMTNLIEKHDAEVIAINKWRGDTPRLTVSDAKLMQSDTLREAVRVSDDHLTQAVVPMKASLDEVLRIVNELRIEQVRQQVRQQLRDSPGGE